MAENYSNGTVKEEHLNALCCITVQVDCTTMLDGRLAVGDVSTTSSKLYNRI